MVIRVDDLAGPEIRALLEEHLRSMHELSPPESVHALDLAALRQSDITFWTVWADGRLLGCGALKEIDPSHGEVKSMRTALSDRRTGVGRAVLTHIINEARARSYARVSLETGSMEAFEPARCLYQSFGFTFCGPFANYTDDPNSVFMTLVLRETVAERQDRFRGYLRETDPLALLTKAPATLAALLDGASDEARRRSPGPGKWSVAQIVAHLADMELVLGYRLRQVVSTPGLTLQVMDQDAWARSGRYQTATTEVVAALFASLRSSNLRFLHGLSDAEWASRGFHPERGEESVMDMVKYYAGHDINHFRQVELILTRV